MAPVTKCNREKGQISIFFSASLIVLISIIAFVINIGLFVKAKINLQNATDAAAFSGAAVQARHLSRIAYLNWEMRNIYKEWMYKYYVVGNLNVDDVETPGTSGPMNFRLRNDTDVVFNRSNRDYYNIPAVCIHIAGSKTNICRRYSIPGLPEFGSSNLPGAEEASRAFMDALIGTKINDCVERTKLNMLVASTWTYNVQANDIDDTLTGRGPAILANRQGAWPKAVELAMRMRNLEYAMNRPPQTSGVCESQGQGLTSCRSTIQQIIAEKKLGNERLIKAFYSGQKNLGNETDNEMKNTFTLTEIGPKRAVLPGQANASYLLMPDGNNFKDKYYVDLKLQMVNLAIFYAAMIPRATTDTSGACDISKVAIPVPGYPLGFYKNPDVVTYYAVRGEAEFVGMFNPFQREGIKMTAYAAAKPMGGRIGPMIYTQKNNQDYFTARSTKYRSVPYITTLEFEGTPKKNGAGNLALGEYAPGVPLPINSSDSYFWLKDVSSPLGGLLPGNDVQFGIPNLVYDYETPFMNTGYSDATARIHKILTNDPPPPGGGNAANDKAYGLYSRFQFNKFKGTLPASITQQDLEGAIERVRAPTIYDTANYMVPSPNDLNIAQGLDSFGAVGSAPRQIPNVPGGLTQYRTSFFAPLTRQSTDQTDILYANPGEVITTIFNFMRKQEAGVRKYRASLNQAAKAVYLMGGSTASEAANSREKYEAAAAGISDINFNLSDVKNEIPASCKSLAGQFLYFFYGDGPLWGSSGDAVKDTAGCPKTLGSQLTDYFTTGKVRGPGESFSPNHYQMNFNYHPPNFDKSVHTPKEMAMFSAYMPGPFTGVGLTGTYSNPISNDGRELMRRNFYSTKFVTIESLAGGAESYSENQNNFPIMSEGAEAATTGTDISQSTFQNSLDTSSFGDLSGIKY